MERKEKNKVDNYICIDGVKVLLNDLQISELRAALEKKTEVEKEKPSPFERQDYDDTYYYIDTVGEVSNSHEVNCVFDSIHHDAANYCADEELLKQRALEEILARRLWRYSMEHDGDKIDWSSNQSKYVIYYDRAVGVFCTTNNGLRQTVSSIYFVDNKTAVNAIKEVAEPFMKEYPGFKSYRTCYAHDSKGE